MRVRLETPISKKKQICTVSLIVGEFIIHDVKLCYGRKGFYVLFPTFSHPIHEDTRQKCLRKILGYLKQNEKFMKLHSAKLETK